MYETTAYACTGNISYAGLVAWMEYIALHEYMHIGN